MVKNYKLVVVSGLLIVAIFFHAHKARPNYPRIPEQILYSHYRLVAKVGDKNVCCGTGIGIGPRRILTAEHVVREGTTFELDFFDNDGNEIKTIGLHLIGKSFEEDLALLETNEDLPYYNELDTHGSFEVGAWGYIVGAAHATAPYNTYLGVFASKCGPTKFPHLWQIAVAVPPGESGGGVYNAETNKLVGVCTRSREGFTLFVNIQTVENFLLSIVNHE